MIIFFNQQINLENMNFTFDSNKIDNNKKKKKSKFYPSHFMDFPGY